MNEEQLWETTMNPETRILHQVTIENAAEADRIFSMLMGDDVGPRREFIEKNARLRQDRRLTRPNHASPHSPGTNDPGLFSTGPHREPLPETDEGRIRRPAPRKTVGRGLLRFRHADHIAVIAHHRPPSTSRNSPGTGA